MRFYIDQLLLWLKDGSLRKLQFEEDKVNVITGNSKTGKTAVLEIIDYIFCGSDDTVVISQEYIGENVIWYGMKFCINDKIYTIARGAIEENGKFSKEYFFSQTGEIPEIPVAKMGETEIKLILEKEFSINDDVTVSYGGRSIRRNTRLSFRYFLLFNSLSKDTIDNGKLFFDKLTLERYRDVWPQIFDLSLGVIDFDHLIIQRKIDELHQIIAYLETEKKKQSKRKVQIESQISSLIKKAKEAQIIEESLKKEEAFSKLVELIEKGAEKFTTDFSVEQEYEDLQQKREKVNIQLTKLKRFKKSYGEYKKNLKNDEDSLKPIEYIQREFTENISGEYRQFLKILARDLYDIKRAIRGKKPFEFDIDRKIRELTKELSHIDNMLDNAPHVNYMVMPTAQKLIALGEIKAEYRNIDFGEKDSEIDDDLKNKEQELQELETQFLSIDDRRNLVIDTLNDYIQTYITFSKDALDEYGEYCAWFDYKKQQLTLRKNKTANVAKLSSSSDHLYLHLCLFAGMHQMILNQNAPYIPSFLVIDQPSRPYFNNSEYDYKDSEKSISIKSDWSKVKNIFKLWDEFFSLIMKEKKHFQVIILEHVSEDAWKECEYVHLVEIFDGVDNALIPLKTNS